MSSIGKEEPFDPLMNLREDIKTAFSSYQKHMFSKETHLSILEEKINQLFNEYSALEEFGHLPEHANQELCKLACQITEALSKGTFFKEAKESTLRSLDRLVAQTISASSTPLTPALWAASLAKRGKEEEAFEFIESLADSKEKAEALIEMAKNGASLSVAHKAPSLARKTLVCLMNALESHQDSPMLQNMLCSLPASVALTQNLDEAFSLAFYIKDRDVQAKALAQIVRSGGLAPSELINNANKLPIEKGNALLKRVASEISEIGNNLPYEEASDLSDLISSLYNAQRSEPSAKADEKTPQKGIFGKIRGFMGLSKKTAPSPSPNSEKIPSSSPSILKDEEKSQDTETLSSETAPTTREASPQPYAFSNEELVMNQLGSNLFPVFHQIIGNLPIKNLVIDEGAPGEDGNKISFSIDSPKSKKVPAPELESLLQALGVPDTVIYHIKDYISVTFPSNIKMVVKHFPCPHIEFDPSTPITFSLSSSSLSSMIAKNLLSAVGLSSGASISKIFYILDAEVPEVEVHFDTIKKGAWSNKGLPPVNLGPQENLAMPFWRGVWNS